MLYGGYEITVQKPKKRARIPCNYFDIIVLQLNLDG